MKTACRSMKSVKRVMINRRKIDTEFFQSGSRCFQHFHYSRKKGGEIASSQNVNFNYLMLCLSFSSNSSSLPFHLCVVSSPTLTPTPVFRQNANNQPNIILSGCGRMIESTDIDSKCLHQLDGVYTHAFMNSSGWWKIQTFQNNVCWYVE